MQTPPELLKDVQAVIATFEADVPVVLAEVVLIKAKHPTWLASLKQHSAQIVGAIVFVAVMFAALYLTHA